MAESVEFPAFHELLEVCGNVVKGAERDDGHRSVDVPGSVRSEVRRVTLWPRAAAVRANKGPIFVGDEVVTDRDLSIGTWVLPAVTRKFIPSRTHTVWSSEVFYSTPVLTLGKGYRSTRPGEALAGAKIVARCSASAFVGSPTASASFGSMGAGFGFVRRT